MRFLVIGCFHGRFPDKLKKIAKTCDFVLSTGDFGGSEKLRKLIFKNFSTDYLAKIGKKKSREYYLEDYSKGKKIIKEIDSLNKKTYAIDGNWDFKSTGDIKKELGLNFSSYPKIIKRSKNIKFLPKRIVNIEGLKTYPHGGLMLATIFHEKTYSTDKKNKSIIYKMAY